MEENNQIKLNENCNDINMDISENVCANIEQSPGISIEIPGPSGYSSNISNQSGLNSNKILTAFHQKPNSKLEELTNEEIDKFISKEELEHYEFSGDRHVILYNERQVDEDITSKPNQEEEYSDDFYDLTIGEAQKLLREIKQTRDQLDNGQLMTKAMRELNNAKKTLVTLHQYNYTIIRTHFPNGYVLQIIFKPLENIAKVKQIIRSYLTNPELNFYVYITPPKIILEDKSTLLDLKCVPTGNFYFGVPEEVTKSYEDPEEMKLSSQEEDKEEILKPTPPIIPNYLKSEITKEIVTRNIADLKCLEFRKARNPSENSTEFDPSNISSNFKSIQDSTFQNKLNKPKTSSDKIPKWFKTGK